MSIFGARMEMMSDTMIKEISDIFIFTPMSEMINSLPERDMTRTEARVRVVITGNGVIMGRLAGLTGMQQRSSYSPKLYFMKKDELVDVRKFDRFYLPYRSSSVDRAACYEVSEGPRPIGFGWFTSGVVEISLTGTEMIMLNTTYSVVPDSPPIPSID